MTKQHKIFLLAGVLFSLILCGCVSKSELIVRRPPDYSIIMTGTVRPEISSEEVKIYGDPPAKYETIGMIEASYHVWHWLTRQETQDIVVNELKSQAAKMGANGLIIIGMGRSDAASGSGGSVGSSTVITTQGRAIHVIQE
ncbi:MAG: hypothetical protein FWG79_08975 [Bacteroidales bacterium]|nr:hypothetical protein [Bacteroidales bacterium]